VGDALDGEVEVVHAVERARDVVEQRPVALAPAVEGHDRRDGEADAVAGRRHPPQRDQARRQGRGSAS
jgi:hypothetical protein